MVLLVDVGNTQTVIGLGAPRAPKGEYVAEWRITTDKQATTDDLMSILVPLFIGAGIKPKTVEHAAVSSVVPALKIAWEHAINKTCGVETIICDALCARNAGLFDADYPNPEEIGADRVADAIAARATFGAPIIVVDFGTATNIEVIDGHGRFIGGIIAPGITTGADALFSHASMIYATEFSAPKNPVGRTTATAVSSGVIYGEVCRVDGLLDMVFAQIGCKCRVVATGGLVNTVGKMCKNITDIDPNLTLNGLRMLVEKIDAGKKPKNQDIQRNRG